jgi:hypothetical protein
MLVYKKSKNNRLYTIETKLARMLLSSFLMDTTFGIC